MEWIGILNFGEKVDCNACNTEAFNGYSAKRKFVSNSAEESFINVIKSLNGKPLYEGIVMRDNNILKRYICTNPTSIYRKVICFFWFKNKR